MRALVGVTSLVLAVAADVWATPLVARDILVSIFDQGILAVNPDTGLSTLVAAGSYQDFSIAPTGEIYALTGQYGDLDAEVVRIDPGTGSVETVSSGGLLVRPTGITVNQNGLFVLERIDRTLSEDDPRARIIEIDEVTGAQSLFVENLRVRLVGDAGKSDLESDSNGNLFAAVAKTADGETLARVDGLTGESHVFSAVIAATDIGLGIGPDEDELFIATAGSLEDTLFGFDPLTGDVRRVRGGLPSFDVDIEEFGALIIATDFNIGSLNLCPGTNRCLVRYNAETQEVLYAFTDVRFVREVQIVPATIPEPSTASQLLLGLLMFRRARRNA